MPFTPADIADLRSLMEYEASRTAPPPGFPALPDLPGGRYTDPRFFALEQAHLWRKSWLMAGHVNEIPEPGSYKLWDSAGQPLMLVHARSGEINAFYNVCSHRGAPVVTEPAGKRNLFTCKYHGWSYDDGGALIAIRDPEDFAGLDLSCRGLKRVRCETFGKLIFVNFDAAAPSLLDWLGPIAGEWEEFRFGETRLIDHYVWDLKSNWKVAMEANTEVYHVPNIHPKSVALILDHRRNVNVFYPNGHGRMIAPGRGTAEDNKIRRRAPIDNPHVGEVARTCTQSYGVFPNIVSPLSATAFPMLQFWPNGIGRARMEVWWFGPDWGASDKPEGWADNVAYFNSVLEEDTQFGQHIQTAHESWGFEAVPLSYQEARIYWWNQAADALIGAENIPAELRVPPVIGPEWVHPNDPRLALAGLETAAPRLAAE